MVRPGRGGWLGGYVQIGAYLSKGLVQLLLLSLQPLTLLPKSLHELHQICLLLQ